jgi:hypothetical protein
MHVDEPEPALDFDRVFSVNGPARRAFGDVIIEGTHRSMLLDTGASANILPASFLSGRHTMRPAGAIKVFGKHMAVVPIGSTLLPVAVPGGAPAVERRFIIVSPGEGPALLGLDLCLELGFFNASSRANLSFGPGPIANVVMPTCASPEIGLLISQYADLFAPDNPGIKGVLAEIKLRDDAQPVVRRARPVALALRGAVSAELDAMVARGSLVPVRTSAWASPIVVVGKPNGGVRVCSDYTSTVAAAIDTEAYPLPRQEDIIAQLAGAKVFSTIDLGHAFEQIVLDEESREICTINTPRGLLRPSRLPYGVSSASAILQRTMEGILAGLPTVVPYADDVLIASADLKGHLATLEEVLARFRAHNVRLKAEKCTLGQPTLKFLGFVLGPQGRRADPDRIAPIVDMKPPRNTSELRAFLGSVRFYDGFVNGLANTAGPLNALLRKGVAWHWDAEQQHAFGAIKAALTSVPTLTHYDPRLPIVVSADASPHGLGAVLAHRLPDGKEAPIAYASRTLTPAERRYAQIDKEALALVFAVKRFVCYLWTRPFTLVTDAKPLLAIFGSKRGLPELVT